MKALAAYMDGATFARAVTADDAWVHVYKLLLSMDRRARLAHVYDSNHMQKGGVWYQRAKAFTENLCKRWGIAASALPDQIDVMFKHCVKEYLALKEEEEEDPGATAAEDAVTEFALEVRDTLIKKLGVKASAALDEAIIEIERSAEYYFEMERKRQNVRGEGFEDVLEYFFETVSCVPRAQLKVRTRTTELPGFKLDPPLAKGRKKPKVPKPDIALLSPDNSLTRWIVTAKWSLRQDRLDQFGQEAAYYRDNRIQSSRIEFVFVTNEMDLARLRDVLDSTPDGGGFHFDRVYHLNLDLVEETHGTEAFTKDLGLYKAEGRLQSLKDLLEHAKAHFGPAPTPPARTPARRGSRAR